VAYSFSSVDNRASTAGSFNVHTAWFSILNKRVL
jgi:hypothetical protein